MCAYLSVGTRDLFHFDTAERAWRQISETMSLLSSPNVLVSSATWDLKSAGQCLEINVRMVWAWLVVTASSPTLDSPRCTRFRRVGIEDWLMMLREVRRMIKSSVGSKEAEDCSSRRRKSCYATVLSKTLPITQLTVGYILSLSRGSSGPSEGPCTCGVI